MQMAAANKQALNDAFPSLLVIELRGVDGKGAN